MKLTKSCLKLASHANLIRLAKFLKLRRDLDTMSKNCLVSLILWKIKKDDPMNEKSCWR